MKNRNRTSAKIEIDQIFKAGFSCVFVNGVSFSEEEELYSGIPMNINLNCMKMLSGLMDH